MFVGTKIDYFFENKQIINLIYFLEDKYCKPIVIQTATTNGAVNVVIPAYIPIICIPVDRSMDKVAQTILLKVRFPRAILQSTPLYPSNPALNVEKSVVNGKATSKGKRAPQTV